MDFIIRLGDGFIIVAWVLVLAYIVMSILPIPYSRTTAAIRSSRSSAGSCRRWGRSTCRR